MKQISILVLSLLLLASCASDQKRTATGAGIGAATGAAAGAILAGKGSEGKGAVIGGILGAMIGGGIGQYLDKQAKELAQVAETRRTENGIVTKLKGDITFPSGKTTLTADAQSRLMKIAEIVKKYPEDRLAVIGHTDSTGSDMTNQSLSQARADVVRAILVSNGVPGQYVQAAGMGENQPIASNDTATGRSENRRVEINITVDETALNNKK